MNKHLRKLQDEITCWREISNIWDKRAGKEINLNEQLTWHIKTNPYIHATRTHTKKEGIDEHHTYMMPLTCCHHCRSYLSSKLRHSRKCSTSLRQVAFYTISVNLQDHSTLSNNLKFKHQRELKMQCGISRSIFLWCILTNYSL